MKAIPLRWRLIAALIGLALGTTLALSLLARHFLDLSLQSEINVEMGRALTGALSVAKETYDARKQHLQSTGESLMRLPTFQTALQQRDLDAIRTAFMARGFLDLDYHFVPAQAALLAPTGEPITFKAPDRPDRLQLAIPVGERAEAVLLVAQPLDALLEIENAVHTYKHIEMEEPELRRAFLLAFLVAAGGIVFLASLVGIRIGFGITKPLYALIKGTREMARDNLEYRIPKGRDDEIGLLIESFNHMAEDLKENRRKRLEAEQIAAWREIARRLAHEIKNPLTPIQLTVQQLRDKYSGGDPAYSKLVADCTEIVTEEVDNLRALVQEFADFARMPSLSLALHDLNAVIRDTARLYPDARIRLDLQSDLPNLLLDTEQMRRVLINLTENGIDASGIHAPITVCTQARGDAILLAVSDTGPGVPAEDRHRIFQPYVSTKVSGMGLGLAVVRSIVEDHGGVISVADAPEGGARFEILLPLAETMSRIPEKSP